MQTYIYIVSSPHGGSTLFSHVLGKHPQGLNLGEVSFIPKLLALGEMCSCGEELRTCEFWGDVFAAYSRIVGVDMSEDPYGVYLGDAPKDKRGSGKIDHEQQTRLRFLMMKLRGALDTVSVLHAPRSFGLRQVALSSVTKGVDNTMALYDMALKCTGKDFCVDASKMPRKAAHLYAASPDQVRIIHLIRDGRGVVASRKKYMDVEHAAERWDHYHRLSTKLLERWVPPEHRARLSYEDFVTDPENCLRSICGWLGIPYSDEFLKFDSENTSHAAGGNPARFELAGGIRGVDERWRESLTDDDMATFKRLAGKQNRAFGYAEKKLDCSRMLYLVGGPGNAERVDVSDLFARRIAADGMEVDYIIYGLHETRAWEEIEWRDAKAWVVGRSEIGGLFGALTNKWYELLADLRAFGKTLSGHYDIVQIRDKFVAGVFCAIAAKLRRRKFVYWISYPFAECRIVDGKEGNSSFPRLSILGGHVAMFLLYKIIMPMADHIFVQSEQMKDDIAAHGIDRAKMTPVPMAVAEELLDVEPQDVVPDTILYLGTLIRVRRLDTMLEALQIVRQQRPKAQLIFVGEGDSPADRAFLEEKTQELGLEDAVTFTGMLPMSDAHAQVSKAAVCLSPFYPIPILLSTSPTKISEYMALGRPVVANAHPEQSLIIRDSEAGICVEWSAENFADAILQLLNDPKKAEAMGQRGREYVRDNRTYAVVAPAVADIYADMLADAK